MAPVIETIRYFSALPGSVIHHAAALGLLLAAGALALFGWRRAPEAGSGWPAAALGLGIAAQLAVFSVGVAVAANSAPAYLLPPLDRAASLVLIVALIWAGALPRGSNLSRILPGALVALTLAALVFSWLAWAEAGAGGTAPYNKTVQESAWEAAKIVLLAAGVIVLIARRAVGWWLGVLVLAFMLAGHILHFRFPPADLDYPGAERLANFVALPLLCVLAWLRARAPVPAPARGQVREVAAHGVTYMDAPISVVPADNPPRARSEVTVQARAVRPQAEAVAAEPAPESAAKAAEPPADDAARAEAARLSRELAEAQEALERTRRRAEALAEQEHSRLEEIAAMRADLEDARRSLAESAELEAQLAEARQEADEERARADGLAAELGSTGAKLAELEAQLEGMRPQLEMLDRLWVDLQVIQKQAEERAQAAPEPQPELLADLEALRQQESLLRRELETAHAELKRAGERMQQDRMEIAAARQETRQAQDEAAHLSAKLEKARAKGERMSQQLSDAQAQIERYLDEIETLAALNHQQAEDLDRLQSELDGALRNAGAQGAEAQHLLQELAEARRAEAEKSRALEQARAEADEVRAQAEAYSEKARAHLEEQAAEAQAKLDALAAERAQLAADLQAAQAQAALGAARAVELEAARKTEADLRQELELTRVELAATRNRLERLLEQAAQLARGQEDLSGTTWTLARPAEAFRPAGNGGVDKREGAPPVQAPPVEAPQGPPEPPRRPEPEAPPGHDVPMGSAGMNACAHLGTLEDEDTRFTFSSPQHACYALDGALAIEAEHQIAYCLYERHVDCPIFTGQEKRPAVPINTLAEAADGRRRRRGGLLGRRK